MWAVAPFQLQACALIACFVDLGPGKLLCFFKPIVWRVGSLGARSDGRGRFMLPEQMLCQVYAITDVVGASVPLLGQLVGDKL